MAGTATISTIKHDVTGAATTFRDGAGNEIGQLTKAWVSYNGVTPAIRGSFNTSSVTKNGSGDYTASLSTAVLDINYSVSGVQSIIFSVPSWVGPLAVHGNNSNGAEVAPTTTTCRLNVRNSGGTQADSTYVIANIIR